MNQPTYSDRLGVSPPDLAKLVRRRRSYDLKIIDLLVAVLLEHGGPLSPEAAAARLVEAGFHYWNDDLVKSLKCAMASSPEVSTDDGGRFVIAVLDPADERIARRLRALEPPAPRPGELAEQERERLRREREVLRAAERAEAAALRRVLLHGVFGRKTLRAVGMLDAASREIETFVDDELAALPERLRRYDLAIGISPRPVLEQLGLDPGAFCLADLDRPQKTRHLEGKVLRLTNELLIAGTLGRSRPLGDAAKYRQYLEKGHLGRLRRRLEADIKALWAYYRFGALNRAVVLRWGFVAEWVLAEWAQPGDPYLDSLVQEAFRSGRRLELVSGSPPAWSDPWGRATRVEVVARDRYDFELVAVPGEPAPDLQLVYEARLEEAPAWAPSPAQRRYVH